MYGEIQILIIKNKFRDKKYLLKFFYFKNNSIRCTTDVYFQTSVQIISTVSMNIFKITPYLTWTSADSTKTITYSISDYPGYSLTSWVSIDSVSGLLTITAPYVTTDTIYKFYINSVVSKLSSPILKSILLTVKAWKIANWQTWISDSSSTCSAWVSDYILNTGTWVYSSELTQKTAEALKYTSVAIVAIVSWLVVVSSVINTFSMSSLWSLVNQVQIFFYFSIIIF